MNVFGIGALELLVILLVAFIALGPGKTMETARTIGRMMREARRAFSDIVEAASFDDGGRADDRRRGRAPSPPGEPLPGPAHLAEQTPPAAGDDGGGGGDTGGPDDRPEGGSGRAGIR